MSVKTKQKLSTIKFESESRKAKRRALNLCIMTTRDIMQLVRQNQRYLLR